MVSSEGRDTAASACRNCQRLSLAARPTGKEGFDHRPPRHSDRYRHKLAGHEPPINAEVVRAVLRGIRRTIGTAKAGKAPATADLIGQMLGLCLDNLMGKRDRALLAFGFAGAFRRSELCALEVADLTETPDGLRVLIRRSKGDQEGQGQEIAIPCDYRLRPVEAVQTWHAVPEISSGPVFRAVIGRTVATGPLSHDGAARVVKCGQGRARSRLLRRPQPPLGLPHQCCGIRRLDLEAIRGQPS
jgi:hypothetical protein